MKPVMQTVINNFRTGDCMRACVASIFEFDIETVPNFMRKGKDKYIEFFQLWCVKLGISPLDVAFNESDDTKFIKDCYMIAVGTSPRNKDYSHGVVWLNGKCVHDPHPKGNGLSGKPKTFTVFILQNPAEFYAATPKAAKTLKTSVGCPG